MQATGGVGTYGSVSTGDKGAGGSLSSVDDRLSRLLKPFFHKYDTDKNGSLDMGELGRVFSDMGEKISVQGMKRLFLAIDADDDGSISYDEFVHGVTAYIRDPSKRHLLKHENAGEGNQQGKLQVSKRLFVLLSLVYLYVTTTQ